MNTWRQMSVAMGLMWCLALAGCPGAEEPRYEVMDEPINVVKNMQRALEHDDRDAFLDCFEPVEGDTRQMLEVMFDLTSAQIKFDKALRERFGDEAVDDIEDGMQMSGLMALRDPEVIDQLEVSIDEDRATITGPGMEPDGTNLVRINGEWRLAVPEEMADEPEEELEAGIEIMRAMTRAIDQTRPEIDREDATLEGIMESLNERMMEAMLGAKPQDMDMEMEMDMDMDMDQPDFQMDFD